MGKKNETFYDDVKIIGKNTAYITIPTKLVKTLNLDKGETLRISIQKDEEAENNGNTKNKHK